MVAVVGHDVGLAQLHARAGGGQQAQLRVLGEGLQRQIRGVGPDQAVDQFGPPLVAVAPVRRALGVQLAKHRVTQAARGSQGLDERPDVAPAVLDDQDQRLGERRADPREIGLGPGLRHGQDGIHPTGDRLQALGEPVDQFGVVEVQQHGCVGLAGVSGGGLAHQRKIGAETRAVRAQGRSGGVKIGVAEPAVGFQIGALAPLVPGVDEDQGLVGRLGRRDMGQGARQPHAVGRGIRPVEHLAAARLAGLVVPAGHDRRHEVGIGRLQRRQLVGRHDLVVVDLALEAAMQRRHLAGDLALVDAVRREVDQTVEAVALVILEAKGRGAVERQFAQAQLPRQGPPAFRGGLGVRQQLGAIDDQDRLAAHADVARIGHVASHVAEDRQVVLRRVVLADQDVGLVAVPAPGPVLVGPAQGERQVQARVSQIGVQRPLQQALPVEPVVVEAEARDAGVASHGHLLSHHLGQAQVVIAQIPCQARLVVAQELRLGLGDVGPLGEALAPPGVVLRERMKLRQVEGQYARRVGRDAHGVKHRACIVYAAGILSDVEGVDVGVAPSLAATEHTAGPGGAARGLATTIKSRNRRAQRT